MRPLALCTLLLIAAVPAAADLVPIQLDGYFDDWSALTPAVTDPAGDDGSSGIDFGAVWVANDQDYLYIRFETGADVQPDEQQQMRLYLDTDMDAGTGLAYGGIGAELMWEFGYRDGTFTKGGTATVHHDDVGLLMGPTVSSTEFEIALRRDAVPANGQTLFSGDTVRFILRDAASGGDLAPNSGSTSYTFSSGSLAVDTLDLGRADQAHLRLATWNVENDGLFAGGTAEEAQNRLLDVMDPDVLVVCEAWNHTAGEVGAIIEQHLPSDLGENWYAVKLDAGNVVCSRFPILDSWEVNPGYRITAVLLDLGPDPAKDLLLIACHWRCCTADGDRQEEADSIIEFLADARTPGGLLTVAEGTPFLLAGDLNLVGWRQQLETILTGDIINEGLYGPDSAPDWDGLPLVPVIARQPDALRADTWWNDGSYYYPGKLDWILYTDSALDLHNNFVLETRTMKPETLALHGLNAGDTTLASDHAALVADFAVFDPASDAPVVPGAARGARLLPNAPNPFNPTTELRFTLDVPGRVELGIYDARGRLVRAFPAAEYPVGSHGVTWDGSDGRGRRVASGVYQVLLTVTSQGTVVQEDAAITLVK
ncbi:MAG: FlgD immunoglobulin-like domain containing protein [Candidatus Krumholzibacteriia bacterium]